MINPARFKVDIEVFTPIHIGCGEEYYPTDYVIKENRLCVIDEQELLNNVEKNNKLDEFLQLSSKYTTTNEALMSFIKRYSGNNFRYTTEVEDIAFHYITGNAGAFRAGISRFIRNKFNDEIYIPGSTIKGAIRNAILEMIMLRIEKRFEDGLASRKELLNRLRINCEGVDGLFISLEGRNERNRAQYDIMKYLKVSDFVLNGKPNQKIYKSFAVGKPRASENGRDLEAEVKNIPDLLECVDKNSKFTGEIVIYNEFSDKLNEIFENLGLKKIKISKNNLAMWLRNSYIAQVFKWELQYFKFDKVKFKDAGRYAIYEKLFNDFSLNLEYYKEPNKNRFYMKIGKHGGAVSKTLSGCREISIKVGREWNVSSHQSTLWLAGGLPMGWVKGEIKEI